MMIQFNRRSVLRGGAALGAGFALAPHAFGQAKTLVAATFPGTWNEADRNVIAPAFKSATGAAVTQSIILGTDQVARLTAAKGSKPPFDVRYGLTQWGSGLQAATLALAAWMLDAPQSPRSQSSEAGC